MKCFRYSFSTEPIPESQIKKGMLVWVENENEQREKEGNKCKRELVLREFNGEAFVCAQNLLQIPM